MGEDAVEQEKQSIIPNLFPVGKESVLTAFRDLSLTENSAGADAAGNKETDILRETNPYALASLEDLIEFYAQEEADRMRLGSLMCHRVLREEAKSRGGVLPTLTEDFVKEYGTEQDEKAEREVEEKRPLKLYQVGPQTRRKNITMFRNFEPEFSKIVERELCDQPNWSPEDDFRYTGIIYQYLLFRKGCSNPKNFQKQTP